MRMMPVLAATLALGLAVGIVGGLGLSLSPGGGPAEGEEALSEQVADEAGEDGSLEPEDGTETGGMLSFAISAVAELRRVVGILMFLPAALRDLGLPAEAARALGHGVQVVVAIGLLQATLQFNIR